MDKTETARVNWKRSYYAEADQSDALRKECEALRKDAARYRWLRNNVSFATPHIATLDGCKHSGTRADDLVDAAMAKKPAIGDA